jgi:flagellar biosynthesis/type III secretory pathway M-ring protein FliF/YscJ
MTEPTNGHRPPPVGPRSAMQNTPNAERYVLEADAMRRRQLRSALLHGSRRTWREHTRIWPAIVVGLIVVAVVIAALAVTEAFRKTEENQKKQERQQNRPPSSAPATPGPTSSR